MAELSADDAAVRGNSTEMMTGIGPNLAARGTKREEAEIATGARKKAASISQRAAWRDNPPTWQAHPLLVEVVVLVVYLVEFLWAPET
jgi:hypothetical protein